MSTYYVGESVRCIKVKCTKAKKIMFLFILTSDSYDVPYDDSKSPHSHTATPVSGTELTRRGGHRADAG